MALDEKHPDYQSRLPDWVLIEDCYEGERQVKEKAEVYLPPTSGMVQNGYGRSTASSTNLGQAMYTAYRTRAVFYDAVRATVNSLIGVMHSKPPIVEVPKAMEPLLESISITGESLQNLWRRISEAQLVAGRCGLLVDVPDGAMVDQALPYVAMYTAQTIINWDVGQRRQGRQELELVVLDESGFERQADLRWEFQRQFRIVCTSSVAESLGAANQDVPAEGDYVSAVVKVTESDSEDLTAQGAEFKKPSIGGRTLEQIPFVFINPNDVVPDTDVPPLLGLALLCLAIYRGEADYRQSLFMQGQDTLVREGATEEQKANVGAGAIMDVPAGGKAYYIGVNSSGLSEQREALQNDKAQASSVGVQMLDTAKGSDAESGEALRIRVAARTATLAQIQLTAAQGIKDVLKHMGRWMGVDEAALDGIVVEPNLDFSDAKADPQTLNQLMDAIVKGLPLSLESIHNWLRENEYTDLEFEEEKEKILQERTDGLIADPAAPPPTDIDPMAKDDPEEEPAAA